MAFPDWSRAGWRRSKYSGSNGNCVEVGAGGPAVLVRDTKDQAGAVLAFTPRAWRLFAVTVKNLHKPSQDIEETAVGFLCQRGEILLGGGSPIAGETRRKFDRDFREGAVRLVRETGKPVAQVARDPGVNEGTLGNWISADRRRREGGDGQLSEDERAELVRLRKENAELQMRCVL